MSSRARTNACARWTTSWVLAPLLALTLCLGLLPVAQADAPREDELFEVFWEFRYAGLVDAVVGSYYDGQHFYLSLNDLFGALNLNLTQDPIAHFAHGFYVSTDRTYRLDFGGGVASVGDRKLPLDSLDFVEGQLGYFLRPELFGEIFGLDVALNERQLILSISTEEEMPVVASHRRRLSRVVRSGPAFQQPNYPLLYDRHRSLLNGGVLGYRLTTTLTAENPFTNLHLRGGGEIAGGDLEGGIDAFYASSLSEGERFLFEVDTWRWRYVWLDNPYVTQASVGLLTSDGIRSFSYGGIGISNEPVHLEESFGTYPLRIETEPDWEVEVYVNSQLIQSGTADVTGYYLVHVPITYGSTNVMVREYGPSGEFRETERRVQVPFTFVPPGEIRYNLFAGRSRFDRHELVQASTAVGLTNWLSARVGFDYVNPDISWFGERKARVPWASISARIAPPYVVTLQAAPGARYGGSFNAYFPSLATYGIEFYRNGSNYLFNRQRAEHEARANVLIPFRVGRFPFHVQSNLFERKLATGHYAFTMTHDLSVQPGVFRASLGLRASGIVSDGRLTTSLVRLEPRIGYAIARSPVVPKPFRGILFSVRSSYDLRTQEMLNVSASFSRTFSRRFRVQADVSHYFRTLGSAVTLRALVQLSRVRATTSSYLRSNGPALVSQDVTGAISWDGGSYNLGFADQDWVGRAAATLRLFVDYDGDGHRSANEPFIRNGGIRFRRSVTVRSSDNGFVIAHNLLPYERYDVEIDQSRIRNPLWVPRAEVFSFVADPNVHKVIDVPFYVSGEISGSVLQAADEGLRPIPGLRLHIREVGGDRTWQEAVFTDGSFYKMGLPPGQYEAYVDSSQLRILRVVSDPPMQTFVVRPTELGDLVEGLDFVLRSNPTPSTEEPLKAAMGAPPVEPALRED